MGRVCHWTNTTILHVTTWLLACAIVGSFKNTCCLAINPPFPELRCRTKSKAWSHRSPARNLISRGTKRRPLASFNKVYLLEEYRGNCTWIAAPCATLQYYTFVFIFAVLQYHSSNVLQLLCWHSVNRLYHGQHNAVEPRGPHLECVRDYRGCVNNWATINDKRKVLILKRGPCSIIVCP